MRKIIHLLLSAFAFVGGSANAQITISSNDLPSIGERWVLINDNASLPGTIVSAPGGNQTWDFSTGWNIADTTVMEFVSPFSAPNAADFPTATIAGLFYNTSDPFNTNYQFMEQTSNSWNALGLGISAGFYDLSLNISNGVIIPYPLTYGFTGNYTVRQTSVFIYNGLPIPAQMNVMVENIRYECDGWGSLTVPSGTYNALRLKRVTLSRTDSTFVDTSGTGNNFVFSSVSSELPDKHEYNFYKDGPGTLIMTMEADTATGEIELGSYTDNGAFSAITRPDNKDAISLFPNPANAILNFKTSGHTNAELQLVDSYGKVVFSYRLSGVDNVTISTEGFANGLYICRLVDSNGAVVKNGRVLIQH